MTAVLVIEDDGVIARAMGAHLRNSGYDVEWADDGTKGLRKLRFERPDVCVVDLMLPGLDGWGLIERARDEGLMTPILAVSARGNEHDKVATLSLGADDYLAKPFVMAELGARIRALLRRAHVQSSARVTHGPLVMDKAARRAYLCGEHLDLTAREWAVLEILLDKAEKVVSKESIVQLVARWDDDLSLNAIEVYVSRLRAKLEPAGIRIRTVRGFGYMLEEFRSTN
jgi:DNA-binding response OmpR family regulator